MAELEWMASDPPPEHAHVSGFQAQGCSIGRNIGSRFVNNPNNPNGNPHPANLHAIGTLAHPRGFPYRISQFGHFSHPSRHFRDTLGCQLEAVCHGLPAVAFVEGFKILFIGDHESFDIFLQTICHGEQRFVFHGCGEHTHWACRPSCLFEQTFQVGLDVNFFLFLWSVGVFRLGLAFLDLFRGVLALLHWLLLRSSVLSSHWLEHQPENTLRSRNPSSSSYCI